MTKMMENLQYVQINDETKIDAKTNKKIDRVEKDVFDIDFSFSDTFWDIKVILCRICGCKCGKKDKSYMNLSQRLFIRGQDRLEKDFSNFDIL